MPKSPDLIDRLCKGQQDAASEVYGLYAAPYPGADSQPHIEFLALRLDPDDVLQSVFRAFFQAVRRGVYRVPDSDSLWNLLAAIALNKLRTAHSFHHAARRDVRLTESLPDTGVVDTLLSSDLIEVAVRDILELLPPMERVIAQMRLQGYEIAEIAVRLELSKCSVERLLQRCRQSLRVLLDLEEERDD